MTDDDFALCVRCRQPISEEEDLEWEVLVDEDGNDVGCVCGECITPEDLGDATLEGPAVSEVKLRLVRRSDE